MDGRHTVPYLYDSFCSVADPGCLSLIPEFFNPESVVKKILDSGSALKNFCIFQCCGSGSGIRDWVLFDPRIPDPKTIFLRAFNNLFGKKFYNYLKIGPNFFLQHFKAKIIYNFVKFVAT
jgi:hypothetical protein